ncbi:MAG: FAD-dependent oxidoreductase, partial [Kofleriaceae bacterium]|nr:FAD-dependent oxidoreductase [Kofleriaceae bacterium]
QALGVACHSYTAITRAERDEAGRIRGVVARDLLTGVEHRVGCRMLVIAAGPWTDEVGRDVGGVGRPLLRPTKGVHIVVPRERLPIQRAITLISPVDGRVMFAIPWRERTVVGTTDTDYQGTADEVWADADDIAYLCASANGYFPAAHLTPADVIATWAGLRPLIRSDASDESDVSREHEIFVRDDGSVIIAGGKLTTYRRMAIEAVRKATDWLRDAGELPAQVADRSGSKERPLPGADGLASADLPGVADIGRELMDQHGLDADTATHLCGVYGVRARVLGAMIAADRTLGRRLNDDLPYVWAEVDFAATHDLARTVSDVLARRVPLLLVGRAQGLDVCDQVGARLAARLGLGSAAITSQIVTYRTHVADSRRFQAMAPPGPEVGAAPGAATAEASPPPP